MVNGTFGGDIEETSLLFLAVPLTTILFSTFFFKEKLSYKNIIFISIIVIGAFVLHYQSN
jgi:drug/metabolite transporter (DMT)-like permease